MPGNSQRRGAVRKTQKKGAVVGSGGQRRKQLEGRGPTPKAEERPMFRPRKEIEAGVAETANGVEQGIPKRLSVG